MLVTAGLIGLRTISSVKQLAPMYISDVLTGAAHTFICSLPKMRGPFHEFSEFLLVPLMEPSPRLDSGLGKRNRTRRARYQELPLLAKKHSGHQGRCLCLIRRRVQCNELEYMMVPTKLLVRSDSTMRRTCKWTRVSSLGVASSRQRNILKEVMRIWGLKLRNSRGTAALLVVHCR